MSEDEIEGYQLFHEDRKGRRGGGGENEVEKGVTSGVPRKLERGGPISGPGEKKIIIINK